MTRNFERVDVSFLTQHMQPWTTGAQAIADTDFGDLNRDSIRAMNTNHDKYVTFDEYIAAKGVSETASRKTRESFRREFNVFAVKIMILTGEVHTRLSANTYFVKGRRSADLCRHVRERTPVCAERDLRNERFLRDFLLDGAFFCRGESFRSVLLRTFQDREVMKDVRRYAAEVAMEVVPPLYLPTLLRSLIAYPSDSCVHVMAGAKVKKAIKDPKLQAKLMAQVRRDESAYVQEWLAGERGDDCSVGWAEFAGFLNGPIILFGGQ